jgi:hypothetical protein
MHPAARWPSRHPTLRTGRRIAPPPRHALDATPGMGSGPPAAAERLRGAHPQECAAADEQPSQSAHPTEAACWAAWTCSPAGWASCASGGSRGSIRRGKGPSGMNDRGPPPAPPDAFQVRLHNVGRSPTPPAL